MTDKRCNWRAESDYDIDPDSDWYRCTRCKQLTQSPWAVILDELCPYKV